MFTTTEMQHGNESLDSSEQKKRSPCHNVEQQQIENFFWFNSLISVVHVHILLARYQVDNTM